MTRPMYSLLCLLALAACDGVGPLGGSGPSFLRAAVSGSVDVRYEGTGDFWTGGSGDLGRIPTFGINSRGLGSLEGQSLSLWRQGRGRPGEGTYELAPPDHSRTDWTSFAAVYRRIGGGTMEAFVARSGEVRITRSSADRIEGTFRFSGVRYCARPTEGTPRMEGSCRPDRVEADAPAIQVSGSFAAEPFRVEAVPGIWR